MVNKKTGFNIEINSAGQMLRGDWNDEPDTKHEGDETAKERVRRRFI